MGTTNVGSGRRWQPGASRLGLGRSGRGAPFGLVAGTWARFGGLAAVFLEQLLRGIVLGGRFELFDGLVALFLEVVEAALGSCGSVLKDPGSDGSHRVDSGKLAARPGEAKRWHRTGLGRPRWRRTP